MWRLLREFSTDVNVRGISVHRATNGEIAFDEFVGITTQGFTVLAGSRSTLVSIDDGVPRSKQIPERTGTMDVKEVGELLIVSLTRLVRITPLENTGKTDTSMGMRTRIFDSSNDPVAVCENVIHPMPVSARLEQGL